MADVRMNPSASVVVSGLPGRVNSQLKLREHFQTAHRKSGIRRLITFLKLGAALIEFQTPEGAADVLANEALLEVRGLSAVFPQDENKANLPGEGCALTLLRFLYFLPGLHGHTRESGSNLVSIRILAELDMDPDSCVVMSGFPDGGAFWPFSCRMKHLLRFQEIGTALAEFSSPEEAAVILVNKRRLLEKTGLQVRKLETLLCLKQDVTTQQSQVSQLQRQLKTVKQNPKSKGQQLETARQNQKSKEDQLQQVTTVNKSLQAALKREKEAQKISINLSRRLEQENSHLKNQAQAYKRKIERLENQLQISSSTENSSLYEMTCDPRGVAVIINNIRFEDMADREGAEGDTDRLREVFESLGFTVVTFTDLDHAKMVAAMKDQGKADHSNHDCFVCCIMSHGTMGKVFSSDDVGLDICELMKPVNAKKCPSLKGKPKLFFIQACQGEKTQGRESFDGDHDAKPVPFICHEADFFLGLATVPGYVALRNPDGAPYVKHLAKMLRDFGPTHDLSAIMAMVCDKMNEVDAEKCGWISLNHSTLRKNLIFKPK